MVTSRDVARLAGVSQSTVSYVMSGKRSISPTTRIRVEHAMAELAFHPHAAARALAGARTGVVALIVGFGPAADTAGVLPFIETIARTAREADRDVLLVTSDEGTAALTRLAGRMLCDGVIVMDVGTHDPRVAVAAGLGIPVVLIGVPQDPCGLPCVDLDFAAAAGMLVAELQTAGHDRIVVVDHPPELVTRGLNFVDRFRAGLPEQAKACLVGAGGLDAVLQRAGPERVGLVVPHAGSLPGVLQVLRSRGLEPGRDLSLVAICAESTAAGTHPAVTHVSTASRDVSSRAMRALLVQLGGGIAPATDLISPVLHRGQSVLPAIP